MLKMTNALMAEHAHEHGCTLSRCTIPDDRSAVGEVRRALRAERLGARVFAHVSHNSGHN
jgi:hypothetical protein